MSPVVPWAPIVGSNGGHMYGAGLSQKVLLLLLASVSPSESLNSIRTYVRFVCESDHRDPLHGGRSPGASVPTQALADQPGTEFGQGNVAFRSEDSNKRPGWGLRCSVAAVKKSRIDAVLAERGLFPSRSAAAGRGAGRRSPGRPGRAGGAAPEPAGRARGGADRRPGPALRLPRRHQARERARGARDRRRRPRLPRRRRLDRRLHRLPAAARRRRGWPRSTSPTASSTCGCARIRG